MTHLAALSGRRIDLTLLQSILPNAEWDSWLFLATENAILSVEAEQWQFAHDKLRDTIIYHLSEQEVQNISRTLALTIEKIYKDDTAYVERLFMLWRQANDLDKEVYYLEKYSHRKIEIDNDHINIRRILSDTLERLPERSPLRLKLLYHLILSSQVLRDAQGVQLYGNQLESLAKEHNDQEMITNYLDSQGIIAYYGNDYDSAHQYFTEALALRKQIDNVGIDYTLNHLGLVLHRTGHSEEALSKYQEVITLRKAVGELEPIAVCYNNMGIIELERANQLSINDPQRKVLLDRAYSYHQEAYDIRQKTQSIQGKSFSKHNLGVVAFLQQDYELAHNLFEDSLILKQQIGDNWGIATTFTMLGEIAFEQREWRNAKIYLLKALEKYEIVDEAYGISESKLMLGQLAFIADEISDAQQYFEDALEGYQTIQYEYGIVKSLQSQTIILQTEDASVINDYIQSVLMYPNMLERIPVKLGILLLEAYRVRNLKPHDAVYYGFVILSHPDTSTMPTHLVNMLLAEVQDKITNSDLESLQQKANEAVFYDLINDVLNHYF